MKIVSLPVNLAKILANATKGILEAIKNDVEQIVDKRWFSLKNEFI